MPDTFEIIKFLSPLIISLITVMIGAVIWFIRLEGRVNYGEKSDLSQDKRMDELDRIIKQQSEMTQVISSIQNDLTWIKKLMAKALKVDIENKE